MGDKQDTLHENIEVLERTALLADWFSEDARQKGKTEAQERTKHDAQVLRGYSFINEQALKSLGPDDA